MFEEWDHHHRKGRSRTSCSLRAYYTDLFPRSKPRMDSLKVPCRYSARLSWIPPCHLHPSLRELRSELRSKGSILHVQFCKDVVVHVFFERSAANNLDLTRISTRQSSVLAHLDEPDLPPVLPNLNRGRKSNRGLVEIVAGHCILSTLVSQDDVLIRQAFAYEVASEDVIFPADVLGPFQQSRIYVVIGKATAMTQKLAVTL